MESSNSLTRFKRSQNQITRAVEAIEKGDCKRVDVGDLIIVYKCGTVIRIDIKETQKK